MIDINKENVQATVDKLNDVLFNNKAVNKKVKTRLRYIIKNYPSKIQLYEKQEVILAERNSYSKTDTEATFMRMKEAHMLNGQLKPAYNIQISTSNQYIVNYTVHANPTDTRTLSLHLDQHKKSYNNYPKEVTADAGYGSEENYDYLEENQIKGYIKYSLFDKQQKGSNQTKAPFSVEKLFYNKEQDCYICPMGQTMSCLGIFKIKNASCFEQEVKKYQAVNCINCPLNGACHKRAGNRIIQVNENLNRLKELAYELLNSEEGIIKRKKRCCDVEPVFGNIKQNHNFRRFMLRGKDLVSIEWGLLAIAQNLRKKAA